MFERTAAFFKKRSRWASWMWLLLSSRVSGQAGATPGEGLQHSLRSVLASLAPALIARQNRVSGRPRRCTSILESLASPSSALASSVGFLVLFVHNRRSCRAPSSRIEWPRRKEEPSGVPRPQPKAKRACPLGRGVTRKTEGQSAGKTSGAMLKRTVASNPMKMGFK